MFNNWMEIFCQLVLVRVALMIIDIQLRSYEFLYNDLEDMHWYIEPLHEVLTQLYAFQRTVEDHNTYLSYVLGVDANWRN